MAKRIAVSQILTFHSHNKHNRVLMLHFINIDSNATPFAIIIIHISLKTCLQLFNNAKRCIVRYCQRCRFPPGSQMNKNWDILYMMRETYIELLLLKLCTNLLFANNELGATISIPSTLLNTVENNPNSFTNNGISSTTTKSPTSNTWVEKMKMSDSKSV